MSGVTVINNLELGKGDPTKPDVYEETVDDFMQGVARMLEGMRTTCEAAAWKQMTAEAIFEARDRAMSLVDEREEYNGNGNMTWKWWAKGDIWLGTIPWSECAMHCRWAEGLILGFGFERRINQDGVYLSSIKAAYIDTAGVLGFTGGGTVWETLSSQCKDWLRKEGLL